MVVQLVSKADTLVVTKGFIEVFHTLPKTVLVVG